MPLFRKKTLFIMLATFLSLIGLPFVQPAGAGEVPSLEASAAILIERTTGEVLYSKNPDEKLAPASTTKILTALVALETGRLEDLIRVGANPPLVEGTRTYLAEGEENTLENLLYGLLLQSGNDAALAIAEHYGGSVEGFARMMNEKAKELGAVHTNFTNPHGLSEPQHYTTARDLAIMARAAMENETFRRIVATKTIPWESQEWETTLLNHNRLVWNYEGADGIKNGYTSQARFTLVGSATREGQSFIAVVLGEPSAQTAEKDAAALLDYGFDNFRTYALAQKGDILATLELGKDRKVELAAAADLTVVWENNNRLLKGQLHMQPLSVSLPEGSLVGEMIFQDNGQVVGRVEVINCQAIPAGFFAQGGGWLGLGLILVAFALLNPLTKKALARSGIVQSLSNLFSGLK